jgi:GPH family glycoside/pentoside/hexuronide:cation symporter
MAENEAGKAPVKKTPWGVTRFFYGVGDWAFTSMSNVETYFFNFFLTNVANFAPVIAGTIGVITSTIDAALSWIYGGILNAVKPGRFGRYRTWMVMLPWVVPFLYTFQFLKIGEGPLAYVLITLGFVISHIVWNLPWTANVVMTSVAGVTADGRAALASSRATWNQIAGITFSYIGPPLATVFGAWLGAQYGYAALAFVLGWVMVLGYFVNFLATQGYEEIETGDKATAKKSKTRASVKDMAKALAQNPSLIALIIADIPKMIIRFVPGAVAAYYFLYVAEPLGMTGMLPRYILIVNIGAMLGAFASAWVARSFGTRNAVIGSYFVMAAALIVAYISYQNPWLVIAMMTITQFGQGVGYSLSIALFGDCAVYSQHKTGVDSRGWIVGLNVLPLKVAIIGRPVILNTSLALVGFNAAAIRADPSLVTEALQRNITAAFALIPAIILIIGALIYLFGFRITREQVVKMQEEIDARQAKQA